MVKLRTVYPHGLNKKVDKNVKMIKTWIELKDSNSIKCCCNRCNISFLNNHYGHITTGGLNIADNEKLRQLISKHPKYPELKQINFKAACEEIQTDTDQFIKRILNDKDINKNLNRTKTSTRTFFQNRKVMQFHQQMKKFIS